MTFTPDMVIALATGALFVVGGLFKIAYSLGKRSNPGPVTLATHNHHNNNGHVRRTVSKSEYEAGQVLWEEVTNNLKEGQKLNRVGIGEMNKAMSKMVDDNKSDHRGLYEKINELSKVLYQRGRENE